MQRAGQTPHGARPNREEIAARPRYVPARCVKPPGRSLEPRSNARPRGMAVPQQRCCGQNSAYRSGCHKFLFSITSKANKASCDAGVTRLRGAAATGIRKSRTSVAPAGTTRESPLARGTTPEQLHEKVVIGTNLENENIFILILLPRVPSGWRGSAGINQIVSSAERIDSLQLLGVMSAGQRHADPGYVGQPRFCMPEGNVSSVLRWPRVSFKR